MTALTKEFQNKYRAGYVACEGTTEFFRYPDTLDILADYALSKPTGSLSKFLFAPCSIGSEPFSFAMVAEQKGVFLKHPELQLYGLDISETFIEIARAGKYPSAIVRRRCDKFVNLKESSGMSEIVDSIRSRVTFFPAQDILLHQPEGGRYDATMCFNLLLHLNDEGNKKRKQIFEHLASITSGVLCVDNAESIKREDVIRLTKKKGMNFSSLNDFFNGKVVPVKPKSSDYAYNQVLGYFRGNTALATMCMVAHR